MSDIKTKILQLNDEFFVEFATHFATEFKLIMLGQYSDFGSPNLELIKDWLDDLDESYKDSERLDKSIVKAIEIKESVTNMERYQANLEYQRARGRAKYKAYSQLDNKYYVPYSSFKFRYTKQDYINDNNKNSLNYNKVEFFK